MNAIIWYEFVAPTPLFRKDPSMDLKRRIIQDLQHWRLAPQRKPLVLLGARQVGKTSALKSFGRQEFREIAYLNFEERPLARDLFKAALTPSDIVKAIGIELRMQIEPGKTLMIFDEVQEAPEALTSLRYFCEQAPEYHVAAAGSLLEVKIKRGIGFPVGNVDFMQMYPLSFSEFLDVKNEGDLAAMLGSKADFRRLPESLHLRLLDLLKVYMLTGGMP